MTDGSIPIAQRQKRSPAVVYALSVFLLSMILAITSLTIAVHYYEAPRDRYEWRDQPLPTGVPSLSAAGVDHLGVLVDLWITCFIFAFFLAAGSFIWVFAIACRMLMRTTPPPSRGFELITGGSVDR